MFFSSLELFHAYRVVSPPRSPLPPARMLFNFKCKKVLFKDFFPILFLCVFKEQMELKPVNIQARLRAPGGKQRSLVG